MSYILDALKKAESERESGVVPGLSSTQTSYSTYISYGGSQRPWWLVLVLGLLVALVLGIWAWRQPAGNAVPAPTAPLASPAAAPVAPKLPDAAPVIPAPVAAQKPEPQVTQVTQVAKVEQATGPRASAPVASSTVVQVIAKAAPAPVLAIQAVPVPVVQPTAQSEPVAKAVPAGASPVRAASGVPPLLSELPEAMRRQIPALNISGAIYSDSPPEWTLIINDQVMSRGSQVAPELRLEDISATSAVFHFRGQRFRVDR